MAGAPLFKKASLVHLQQGHITVMSGPCAEQACPAFTGASPSYSALWPACLKHALASTN